MCGITGIFDSRGGREIDRRLLVAMTDRIAHRGPDGSGYHLDDGIGLGHRRLAIIDLHSGDQPLFSEDRKIAVVFNGEIYTYRALRAELEGLGYRFRTDSDTETIVYAWREWGASCVERLRGMFAIALWDADRETLFLARDRLGKKPIYYTLTEDGRLLFASELKSLLLDPAVRREIDREAVENYLAYGYIPDPQTIYRGIRKLPPATTLCWRRGEPMPKPVRYWKPSFVEQPYRDSGEAEAELVSRFREAVDIRRVSDVPIGAFLSGGVDSSAVVAMMAGLQEEPVNTFSIGFSQREFDESEYAAAHAARYHTNHVAEVVEAERFDLVDRLAGIYDEPFADASALPTFVVSELARRHVKVVLSGDGGDEVFAGYDRYLWHRREEALRRCLPDAVRRPLFGLAGRMYPKIDWAPRWMRAKTTLQELGMDAVGGYFQAVSVLNDEMRAGVQSVAFRRDLGGYGAAELLRGHMGDAGTDDPLAQVQYADLMTWLPGDILVKVDRASMANSLETRAPLLDHELIDWACGLPGDLKLAGGEGKHVLKHAMEPYVSDDILYRPKMGFSMPLARWFRGPLRERLRAAVTSEALSDSGLFDMARLRRLVDQHQSGQRDHHAALWLILMFESFIRSVHESSPLEGRAGMQEKLSA